METKKLSISIVNLYTMTSQQILQSDLLDILFEKRNKLYGAYHLRRAYNSHLLKAVGGTALLVVALLFLGGSSKNEMGPQHKPDDFTITSVSLPLEKKPEIPQPKKSEPAAHKTAKQEIFTDQIKPVDILIDPLATQKQLEDVGIGNIRIDGPPTAGIPTPPQTPQGNGGGNLDNASDKNEAALPSRQPQFPGGQEAWANFLNRHLRPPQDMEPGEKRMSMIRFSVDEAGIITNFQIVQSGGSEFDNEVIRVLKKMPNWLPALQNGRPIAVSFTQPVTFMAQDE